MEECNHLSPLLSGEGLPPLAEGVRLGLPMSFSKISKKMFYLVIPACRESFCFNSQLLQEDPGRARMTKDYYSILVDTIVS